MNEILLWLIFFTAAVAVILLATFLFRGSRVFQGVGKEVRDELRQARDESRTAGKELREEVMGGLKSTSEVLTRTLEASGKVQHGHLDSMSTNLKELTESNQEALDRIRATFDLRVKELQESNEKKLTETRKESSDGLKSINDALSKTLEGLGNNMQTQLEAMTKQLKEVAESNQGALDRIRDTFDVRVKELQDSNERKLEEMRKTVDEKLHDTLEKRLGESFKLVSDRLQAVHQGLGEMQTLAAGVGDLKRVLTNVKTRGSWAEFQLGAILEQILSPGQYDRNVRTKGESSEAVEYAVRLPGPKGDPKACIWLPIDSKFPQEDYVRLQQAAEKADAGAVQKAIDGLLRTIRNEAKSIHDKYVNPPNTTDFGIMYLATEGLYAEVLRQPDLVENLLHQFHIVVAGPTTLAAILSSLRMGFQTLAIEQRAAEVWKVLGAVKTEFGKFGAILDKVSKQLNTAHRTIEETGVRTRVMEKRLRSVEQLPDEEATRILELPVPQEEMSVTEEFAMEPSVDGQGEEEVPF